MQKFGAGTKQFDETFAMFKSLRANGKDLSPEERGNILRSMAKKGTPVAERKLTAPAVTAQKAAPSANLVENKTQVPAQPAQAKADTQVTVQRALIDRNDPNKRYVSLSPKSLDRQIRQAFAELKAQAA